MHTSHIHCFHWTAGLLGTTAVVTADSGTPASEMASTLRGNRDGTRHFVLDLVKQTIALEVLPVVYAHMRIFVHCIALKQ